MWPPRSFGQVLPRSTEIASELVLGVWDTSEIGRESSRAGSSFVNTSSLARSRGRPSAALAPRRRMATSARFSAVARAPSRRWAEVAPPAPDPKVDARARDAQMCARSRTTSSRAARASSPCRRPPSGKARATRPHAAASPHARARRARGLDASARGVLGAHRRARAFLGDVAAATAHLVEPRGAARAPRARRAGAGRCSRRASPASSWPCASRARVPRGDHRQPRGGARSAIRDAACAALEKTLAKADTVLVDVDKIGSGAASVLETASRGRMACCNGGSRTCPTPPAGR